MSVRSANSPGALLAGCGIIGIGVMLALAANVAAAQLSPAKLAFILGGFALLIPTVVLKDPKAYWLFLLAFSIPFDITKLLSAALVQPQTLVDTYGEPAAGTTGIELYLTDVVMIPMLLPWFVQIALRRQPLYFPKIAYLFVAYLAWSLLVSLVNAQSYYLSMFELLRQTLYFGSFVYIINNVTTQLQTRSVVLAVFVGFVIGAGTVIIFFELGIGTESSIFAKLHDIQVTTSQGEAYKPRKGPVNENLTLHGMANRRGPASRGEEGQIKRSQGMFRHPAIAANFCGLILPIVLAYLVAAKTNRDRFLFGMVFALGIIALVLTFSRGGAIGFTVGALVFLVVGSWSGLVSRRVLIVGIAGMAIAGALGIPFLLIYFGSRPDAFLMRFYLFQAALQGYAEHPILGVGLNNATAAMKAGRQALKEIGVQMPPTESADSFYLVILTEVGPLGFLLFSLFFGKIVMIALRAMKESAAELRPLLVGIVAGLAGLATQNIADDTLGGHAISGLLWLFAGLVIATARQIQTAAASSPAARHAAAASP